MYNIYLEDCDRKQDGTIPDIELERCFYPLYLLIKSAAKSGCLDFINNKSC